MNQDPPKWMKKLFDIIYEIWGYHGLCSHVNFQHSKDEANKLWLIKAAPVYQMMYGGEFDGKKQWTGFAFDSGRFASAPGVWVQNHLIASYCSDCTPCPKQVIQGKYQGHNFMLHILMEPDPASPIVEIVDHIKKEIREATPEEIDLARQNEEISDDEFAGEASIVWIPKKEYRDFVKQDQFTNEELVELFIDKTMYWYTDEQNGLFGWQKCVRAFLMQKLQNSTVDYESLPFPEGKKQIYELGKSLGQSAPFELTLVENKFCNDWIGPEGMFQKKEQNGTT